MTSTRTPVAFWTGFCVVLALLIVAPLVLPEFWRRFVTEILIWGLLAMSSDILIDELFQRPSITISQAAALLNVTGPAAGNNVHRLVSEGILREVTGRKRNQVFVADEILSFMYDAPTLPPAGP